MITPLALLLALSSAPAAGADVFLKDCADAERALEYVTAVTRCAAAAADPRATPEQVVQALAIEASSHIALNEHEAAVQTYVRLLNAAPNFALDNTQSPVLKAALDQARGILQREGKVEAKLTQLRRDETGVANVAYMVTDPLRQVYAARLAVYDNSGGELSQITMASTPAGDNQMQFSAGIAADIAHDARGAQILLFSKSGDAIEVDVPAAELAGPPAQVPVAAVMVEAKWPSATNLVLAPTLAGGASTILTGLAVASLFLNVGAAPAVVLIALSPLAASAASAAFVRPLLGPAIVAIASGGVAMIAAGAGAVGTFIYFSPGEPGLRKTAGLAANVAFIGGAIAVPVVAAVSAAVVAAPAESE